MSTFVELENEIMSLPAAERERLATAAWESLVNDPEAGGNREIDPGGIQVALQRDAEIDSGKVQPSIMPNFYRGPVGHPNDWSVPPAHRIRSQKGRIILQPTSSRTHPDLGRDSKFD